MTAVAEISALGGLRQVLEAVGGNAGGEHGSWFVRLVRAYLHYRVRRPVAADARPETDRAKACVRAACVKSAIGGATSGAVITGATIATAEIPSGWMFAVPLAAAGVGIEMLARAVIHLDMVCDLAGIFGQRFDPDAPTDLWHLYALVFKTHKFENDDDPGSDLIQRIGETEASDIGESLSERLLGESVIKNIVPVISIAASSVTNYRRTRQLGDTARRYFRYRRAISDALDRARALCEEQLDLLIEGLWFLFIADGRLVPEETTILLGLLGKLDPERRAAVKEHFVVDESGWLERLGEIPPEVREPFFNALEVAAAVDKAVSLPEQKILSQAARRLGRTLDMNRVERMIQEFEDVGVLRGGRDGRAAR